MFNYFKFMDSYQLQMKCYVMSNNVKITDFETCVSGAIDW